MSQSFQTTVLDRKRILVPDIDWVEIPGGPFIYQEGETKELPRFWIARYPITNQQYDTFVNDGGYEEDRWWIDLKRPEPRESKWSQPNRPRTDVDWYEAVAFSRWLSARLGLDDGAVRLPKEMEWERAARGTDGRVYPWGETYQSGYANLNEKSSGKGPWYLKQTTAIGQYPQGDSPHGIADMAGTVWEWCLNKYDQSEAIKADASRDFRVLRGGSWNNVADLARADNRNWSRPSVQVNSVCFRLVSSVPTILR